MNKSLDETVIQCCYLDGGGEFCQLLSGKLGSRVRFEPISEADLDNAGVLAPYGVLIVCIPHLDDPEYRPRFATLERAVLNAGYLPVVVLVPFPEREIAHAAIAAGAYDCLAETRSIEEIRIVLRRAARYYQVCRECERIRRNGTEGTFFGEVVGADRTMTALFDFARKVARTSSTILITGETGTGKEVLARAIHQASERVDAPFVAVACSSLPETLIESELFGHERGAFTGAVAARRGRFEAAQRGTIFLDEIGELSAAMQVKLLRVLQERVFERLGSNHPVPMDARVICATNRNLKTLVQSGTFRADLYYRLNTIEMCLPPLRERSSDILLLANTLIQKYCKLHGRPVPRISRPAGKALELYSWPGNIRELQHVMERALVLTEGPEIQLSDLPSELADTNTSGFLELSSYEAEVRMFKRQLIQRSLQDNGFNKAQAARALNISRSSLHRLIAELGIQDVI